MNKIYKFIFLIFVAVILTNCEKDPDGPAPLRDYQEVYTEDLSDIEKFLKTHSYTVNSNSGQTDDQDVTFTYIPVEQSDAVTSIWETGNLLTHTLTQNGIEYTIYYLKFREGGGADTANLKPMPTDVDGILASYEGSYLFKATETELVDGVDTSVDKIKFFEFESNPYPQSNLNLEAVIKGWREIFPMFRPGDFTTQAGQPAIYTDFGAGIMFLPSGLGYFANAAGSIPTYSPLVFSFKLYEITRQDHDGDGVPSYLEDIHQDRYLTATSSGTRLADDTDGDTAPDYRDLDDDGDQILTKNEVTLDEDGNVIFEDCDADLIPNYLDPDPCQ